MGRSVGLAVVVCALSAAPAFAARSWRAPVVLSATGGDAWIGRPMEAMALSRAGDATIAWMERHADGSTPIRGVVKPKGGPLGDPVTLGGGVNAPTVAAQGAGALVAWVGSRDPDEAGNEVLVAERRPDGGFDPPRVLATTPDRYSQPGATVAANDDGDAVVVFASGPTDDKQVWSVRRRNGVWGPPRPVSLPLGASVWRLHAALSATGEAVYAWLSWSSAQGESAWTAMEPRDGVPTGARPMQAPGHEASAPHLAVDAAGNGVVTWVELERGYFAGPLRAAVRAPGRPFGEAHPVDGQASDTAGAPVALTASGEVLVAWKELVPTSANTGSGSGVRVAAGHLTSDAFGPARDVSGDLAADPVELAADSLGNAAIFFEDWDTSEWRVVRRSAAGHLGQPRNVGPCPREYAYSVAADVDAQGDASLLLVDADWLKASSPLMLLQDEASPTFAPDPCPRRPPFLTWTPRNPQPDEEVRFDASGGLDPDAAATRFEWDLDWDGAFELDTGGSPYASGAFPTAGRHRFGLRFTQHSQDGRSSGTSTSVYEISVGGPPEPEPTDPDPWGWDPRPPDEPAEDPWPLTDRAPMSGMPPGSGPTPAPVEEPVVQPSTPAGLARSATPALRIGSGGAALTLRTAGRVSLRALLRRGLPVTVRAARTGPVRVRLLTAGARGRPARPLGSTRTARLAGGRAAPLVLRVDAAGRRRLRSRAVRVLTVEVRPASGGPVLRHRVALSR